MASRVISQHGDTSSVELTWLHVVAAALDDLAWAWWSIWVGSWLKECRQRGTQRGTQHVPLIKAICTTMYRSTFESNKKRTVEPQNASLRKQTDALLMLAVGGSGGRRRRRRRRSKSKLPKMYYFTCSGWGGRAGTRRKAGQLT